MVETEGTWRVSDGVLAGLLELDDVFNVLNASLLAPDAPCTDAQTPVHALAVRGLCLLADIHTEGVRPDQPCNAISAGVRFSASRAQLGEVYHLPTAPLSCDPPSMPIRNVCSAMTGDDDADETKTRPGGAGST